MIRLLIRGGIALVSAIVGLLVTMLLVDGFNISGSGFVITVLIYVAVQMVLSPFIYQLTERNAEVFLGGVGLLSTLVALIAAAIFGSLDVDGGIGTWIISTLLVWLVGAIATFFLPFLLVKMGIRQARERRAGN